MREIISFLAFSIWLILLGIILSRSIHVIAKSNISPFLWLGSIPSFICTPINVYPVICRGQLGCFHVSAVVNEFPWDLSGTAVPLAPEMPRPTSSMPGTVCDFVGSEWRLSWDSLLLLCLVLMSGTYQLPQLCESPQHRVSDRDLSLLHLKGTIGLWFSCWALSSLP